MITPVVFKAQSAKQMHDELTKRVLRGEPISMIREHALPRDNQTPAPKPVSEYAKQFIILGRKS